MIVRAVYGHGYIVGTTHIIGFGVGVAKTFPGSGCGKNRVV